jgi:hypothetical protein
VKEASGAEVLTLRSSQMIYKTLGDFQGPPSGSDMKKPDLKGVGGREF